MDVTFPLWPVYLVDAAGSALSVGIAAMCLVCARRLTRRDPSNALWTYLFWIAMAFAIFSLVRSMTHLVKYALIFSGRQAAWKGVSPLAGGITSATFIFVATLTFYYERVKASYRTLVAERDHLDEARREISLLNRNLNDEIRRIRDSEWKLEKAHEEISRLIDQVRSGGDLSVRYDQPNLVRCWEVKGCVHEECPAYGSENLRCWHVGHAFCCSLKEGERSGGCKCDACPIYASAHRDPLDRLGERFNDMMQILEEKAGELTEANSELRQMDARKTKFLDIVAHDLRTPLTSILSYADLLLRYKSEPEETREEFLRVILEESRRLGDLINDYLDLSKIEAGLLEYHPRALDLREVIDHAVSVYTGACIQKGILLDSEGLGRELALVGDKKRLIQVVSNLLSNACKFTPANGRIEVRAGVEPDGGALSLSVSDTGPGIPEAHLRDIFEKFVQVDQGELHGSGGTGLGLPICKEIVEYHGGRIWAENRPGGGACFHLILPMAGPAEAEAERFGGSAVLEAL